MIVIQVYTSEIESDQNRELNYANKSIPTFETVPGEVAEYEKTN